MSLPPVTVHIKRKATDEPVDFLRVHESNGKRQRRATDFIFTRQQAPDTIPPPGLRPIKAARRASSQALGDSYTRPRSEADAAESPVKTAGKDTLDEKDIKEALQNARQRRFHISRSTTPSTSQSHLLNDKVRKRGQPTVFIERRSQRPISRDRPADREDTPPPQPEPRPQKKPGLATRDFPSASPATKPQPVRLPSGILPWDVNSSQLIAELQAFTLAEIGHSLAESEQHGKPVVATPEPSKPHKTRTSRFRPKAPALRYSERHPDSVAGQSSDMELDEPLHDDSLEDDGDYIIDTYIRVPADLLDSSGEEKNVGLLILDSQPDIEEFYGEGEGSDDDEGEEGEEDENAENHYTADYPDEEVASDDEYGRDAYRYRNRNADDLEEFGEEFLDEDEYLGGDDDGSRGHRWIKKPWMEETVRRGV